MSLESYLSGKNEAGNNTHAENENK